MNNQHIQASAEQPAVERVSFSSAGRALIDEITRRHQLEIGTALDRIGADVGCAMSDGWRPDLHAGVFTRPAPLGPPATDGDPPRVIAPPAPIPSEIPHD